MSSRLKTHFIPVWKQAPFVRLVVPLMLGIVLQWYLAFSFKAIAFISIPLVAALVWLFFSKNKTSVWFGIVVYAVIGVVGCGLVILKDGTNWRSHITNNYLPGLAVIATLQEPLVEKPKSFKAIASVQLVDSNGRMTKVEGNIILYLAKGDERPLLNYGSQLVFTKPLSVIKNAGNPGGFDYKRYAAFHNLYYQVFLTGKEYRVVPLRTASRFQELLFATRQNVINIFRKNIGNNSEAGMAEALLVGYKEDLDKSLVEQYANTGVVHIIAISGMHLGLIYGLLVIVLKPLKKRRYGFIVNAVIIIAALWFFSLLTGAAPSIVRSAIMFTVIVLGDAFSRRTTIYNSLAISAFLLLLYDPFNLWDVGFQLSYAAIISIAILARPIGDLLQPSNWLVKTGWQLVSVTLAAQVFTLPLVLYHFHQFPISFLLSNIIAVPLSSFILYALILLLACSWFSWLAMVVGVIVRYAILFLNYYIGCIDALPHSKITAINYSIPQAILLVLLLSMCCWWLLRRNSTALVAALSCLLVLIISKQWQYYQTQNQHKLVAYNVPGLMAIDIIEGQRYSFIGDTSLYQKGFLQNFHLLPARIFYQASLKKNLPLLDGCYNIRCGNQNVMIIRKNIDLRQSAETQADIVLINGGCKTKPLQLLGLVKCKTVVLDGSIGGFRLKQWKNATDSLHLRLHSVQEQGAFVIDL